jgi:hypothetical protein
MILQAEAKSSVLQSWYTLVLGFGHLHLTGDTKLSFIMSLTGYDCVRVALILGNKCLTVQ